MTRGRAGIGPGADPGAVEGVGRVVSGDGDARGLSIALCASRFHEPLVRRLVEGAARALAGLGAEAEQIDLVWVPGAFELPLAAQALARSGQYDAILALGVVIRGETPHFDYVCAEAARGIAEVSRHESLPVLFGVVTANDPEQAYARCGGASNKGEDVAKAAVELVSALRRARDGR
ncbi:MAG: 6,7-dimethyl-8-ribityllumazine synthase [Candidatus Eiseniibacteriota bacterium]